MLTTSAQMARALQKTFTLIAALVISAFFLSACQTSEEWKLGAALLEERGIDPLLLPDSAPRDFHSIFQNPESNSHVSEQLAIMREAESGARVLISRGFNRKKIPYLQMNHLLAVHRASRSGDQAALNRSVSACENAL